MKKPNNASRNIAIFFLLIFFPSIFPVNLLYASNNGPNAPEAQGFESVNATDMVNLSSGDMSYALPLMEVDGFPITMSYHGGVPLDLESSWTGLGWNLNTGAINRSLNASPDDWKGGNSLDFIKYEELEEITDITVGIGVSQTCEVGIGMSMSSNKGMSGSVFASVGVSKYASVGGSIDTNGNYSLGVGVHSSNSGGTNYGGSMSMSGNVNGGPVSYGVGAGVRNSSGLSFGLGSSLDGSGVGATMGYANTGSDGKVTAGGGASMSTSSFSQGDWDVQSSGWFVPIQVYFITIGFGQRKVTSSLKKAYNKAGYGMLYMNNDGTVNDVAENDSADGVYTDYQNRYRYGDMYDQTLPMPEKEFIGDYDTEREKINFSFAGYDSYDVNAIGISGMMTPKIFQNSTLMGIGYKGRNPKHATDRMNIYYHNTKTTNKFLGTTSANKINFYFDGQFTDSKFIAPLDPVVNNATTGNTLLNSLSTSPAIDNVRLKQGNFVEVFTNKQIRDGVAGFIDPVGLPKSARTGTTFRDEGIGGYRITAPDGKTYHFSQPVYHFEMVDRNILSWKDTNTDFVNDETDISEKRQYSAFATHWLLTAITGPDYYNTSGGTRNYPETGDYGYWIRLDHGKWSDGYVWRNPADKSLKNYSSTIESKINKDDFGNYQFGRKQIYYLDKIVSSTHTAYFVKDLRFDSAGSDLTYVSPDAIIGNDGTSGGDVHIRESFKYNRQMQLRLNKIVLVKNEDATVSTGVSTDPLRLNTYGLQDYVKTTSLTLNTNGGYYKEYKKTGNGTYNIGINQEHNVIDVKDFQNFNYNKAVKVVELDYNYNLAVKDHTNNMASPNNALSKGSPSSVYHATANPSVGKLTLKSIKFKGRNNYDYMPPYTFDYKGEYINATTPYIQYPANALAQRNKTTFKNGEFEVSVEETNYNDIKAKDEWGYLKSDPTAWTLTKINTPTGASINFEHEEDDFYTEAFSRRYWMENLKFKATDMGTYLEIEVQDQDGLTGVFPTDFSDYFQLNERVFLDYWLCKKVDENCLLTSFTDIGKIDITSSNECIVSSVSESNLKIRVNKLSNTIGGDDPLRALNTFYSKGGPNSGSNNYQELPRGNCPNGNGGCGAAIFRDHSMVYKLLANKVPVDETGGGLRVKSITLNDESNNSYKTNYYYNVPGTTREKGAGAYKSSGITSYSPVRGLKFVPYQSELPSPGVMYEYVTMQAVDNTVPVPKSLGETRYRFHVLKPVLNIFDENISMKDDMGREIFKATVTDYNTNNGYFNQSKKLKAKKIDVKVNTSLIGQFRSVEEFNSKGQLMSRSDKYYLTGEELYNLPTGETINRGKVTESFQSMKSIFDTNADGNNPVLRERQLSVSSKTDYQSVLRSISTTTAHGVSTEIFKDTDPNTGTFNTIETKKADGSLKRVQKVPAYTKYAGMGSKVTNINNKNMLTQEAMVITSVQKDNNWKTINASISTWKDAWAYRNEENGTDVTDNTYKVWRKHKNFIWKEALDADGAYATTITSANPYFNFTAGIPTVGGNWKMASEITRYTRFSLPIEGKDINGNFVSSKMGDNNTKTLVSGNARYTEMYYSGAEHVKSDNLFDGEVKGAFYRTTAMAHTGKYSVKAYTVNDKVFEVTGNSGSANYYTSTAAYPQPFRPGKYKISFWAYKSHYVNTEGGNQTFALPPPSNQNHGQLIFNGVEIPVSETIGAGCWQQLNFYIDILPNTANSISVRSRQITGNDFFDDFRMHPVASSVNSYVYEEGTDNLLNILDGNNMATAFKYDLAGRLIANYTEIMDTPSLPGGFKINSQFKQNYKGQVLPNDGEISGTINNCSQSQVQPMRMSIRNICVGSLQGQFKTQVSGGSGSYSYEYRWLLNQQTGEFSSPVTGTSEQVIPYAAKYCGGGQTFDKIWHIVVKVTDNITGQTLEDTYTYETSGCNFSIGNNWATIAFANCFEWCRPRKSLVLHPKDNRFLGNFRYEIAYFDRASNGFGPWIDISDTKGAFCPRSMQVVDDKCDSGYRDFVYIAFRMTNLTTGVVSPFTTYTLYNDCYPRDEPTTDVYSPFTDDLNYMQPGMAIFKDKDGRILDVIDVNRI